MKEYRLVTPHIRGVTDLSSEYCFYGNSQGDETKTNSVADFITSKGWLSALWHDIDYLDQKEVNKKALFTKEKNKELIKSLKEKGTYKEKYEDILILSLEDCPQFDSPDIAPKSTESYRFTFLKLNKK